MRQLEETAPELAPDEEELVALVQERFRALVDAGCEASAALILATHPEIPLPALLERLRRGCSAEMSLRVLARPA